MTTEVNKYYRQDGWHAALRATLHSTREMIEDILLHPERTYRLYLQQKYGIRTPKDLPDASWHNAVLKSREEWESAVTRVKRLGLPLRSDACKNWDTLAALDCILRNTGTDAMILDAGAEKYSTILPWLYFYRYRHLRGINPVFHKSFRRGPILYEHGDVTRTTFKDQSFDAITCLSVIEHGVDLHSYFRETARILKHKGVLITSTDYYPEPTDTKNQLAYGFPIHIFTKDEIVEAIHIASLYGLEMTGPIDLDCQERPVTWEQFGLKYTFIVFALQKID